MDARSVYTVTASPVSAGTTGIGAEVVMEPGMASELLTADFVGSTGTGRLNVTASKPVNITLKVQKPKAVKGSYKPQTTYTMKADAGSAAVLSGKGSNLKSVTFDTLMGMNVKGKENNFLRYFELKDGKLVLKAGLTAEQIAALKADKNDQKGYVTYTAVYGDNGYGVPTTVRRTVMITIRLK